MTSWKGRAAGLMAAAIVTIFAAVTAQAAPPGVCSKYAANAVFQQKKNLAWGCGYTGPRWMKNYGLHYSWCLGAPLSAVQAETAARATMLQQCSGGGGPVTKTFTNPKYKGLRLDWCYSWAQDCGAYAAKAYCVYRGYPLVKSFGFAENIGTFTKTRVFSTGQVCSGPDCDGFSYITCKK